MMVYLLAHDSRGDICVVPISAHCHVGVVTNVGVGPYSYYPGHDVLKQVEASGIPLPLQSDVERTTHRSNHHTEEDQPNKMIGR